MMLDADAPIPFFPARPVLSEVLEHCVTEFDRQAQLGAHIIDITMVEAVDGHLVEKDFQYLETNGG